MEGALAALRSGATHVSLTGLHDVAKALVAAYLTRDFAARILRDRFESSCRDLAETLRFFSGIFQAQPAVSPHSRVRPPPWESQSPHADILERRAATLFASPTDRFPW